MRTRPATAVGGLVLAVVLSNVLGACGFGDGEATTTTLTPLESTEWKTIPTTSTTLSPTGSETATPVGEQQYEIQSGDYPFKVAGLFGCDWEEIAAYNDLDPTTFPFPGVVVLIPATCGVEATTTTVAGGTAETSPDTATTTTAAALPAGQAAYEIQAGDTLSGIATKFDTTMQAIIDLNGWSDGTDHVLIPGASIKVPVAG